MGNAQEMGYFGQALSEQVHHQHRKRRQQERITVQDGRHHGNNVRDCTSERTCDNGDMSVYNRIQVHAARCNQGKTSDGLRKGGKRLAKEIQDYVREDITQLCKQRKLGCANHELELHATISLVGYSLGGLYARYAISCLPPNIHFDLTDPSYKPAKKETTASTTASTTATTTKDSSSSSSCCVGSVKVHLHPNIFMTIVTPHLGLAGNCSFKTSQAFEQLSSRITGQAGLDLFLMDHKVGRRCRQRRHKRRRQYNMSRFRKLSSGSSSGSSSSQTEKYNHDKNTHHGNRDVTGNDENESVLYAMATDYERFLKPLMKFQKRIAYINSFHSDFQVHMTTAGFFSHKSTYPHTFRTNATSSATMTSERKDCSTGTIRGMSTSYTTTCNNHPFILATSTTEQNIHMVQSKTPSYRQQNNKPHKRKIEIEIQNLIMSNKLDALGWTKIFIDSRTMSPIKTLPKIWYSKTSQHVWEDFVMERISANSSSMKTRRMTSQVSCSEEGQPKDSTRPVLSSTHLMSGQFRSVDDISDDGEDYDDDDDNDDDDDDDVKVEDKRKDSKVEDETILITDENTAISPPNLGTNNNLPSFTATSKEVYHYMALNERIQLPVGHSLLIANTKTPCCEKFNRNGRPIVDFIVSRLVEDVLVGP